MLYDFLNHVINAFSPPGCWGHGSGERKSRALHFKPKSKKKFQFPVFLVANIRGGLTTKLDEMQLLFISNDIDICVISETWLHVGINNDILQIADYSLFRLDRRGGQQGGGLAVYVKQGISCSCLSQLTHNELEVLWLLYRPHSMPREVTHLLIGEIYHPPKANNFSKA